MSMLHRGARWSGFLLGATLAVAGASCGGGGEGPSGPSGGPTVARIDLNPGSASIIAGKTTTLTASPKDAAGAAVTGKSISWSTSDASVATVSGGVVTAIKAGSANIVASVGSVQGTAAVTVIPPVATVAITPNPANIVIGQTGQLTATLKDAAGASITDRQVTWKSSNDIIATVSTTGLVTSVSLGSATITATVEEKSATATVNITAVPVASVSVTPPTSTLIVGATANLSATAKDAGGTPLSGRAITWTSSDETVATVAGSGTAAVVTAKAAGSATITATSEGKTATSEITVKAKDVTPPVLAGLSFTPATVDVTTGTKTVLASAHVIDAGGSGTAQIAVVATAPQGAFANCTAGSLTSGTAADGIWNCAITIPKGAQPGDWGILVLVSDAAQNVSTYTATELAAASLPTKFAVVSNWDQTPPVIASLSVAPSTVDVSSTAKTVTVSAHLTDNLSGVARFDFAATSPNGTTVGCSAVAPASGTDVDGTWTCTVTVAAQADPGAWNITVKATDRAFFSQTYDKNIGFPTGFPTTLTVTR